jgi:hypothetical protein
VRFIAALILSLLPALASAQSVRQSGTVTPGHVPVWTADGVIQDGGTPSTPQITGGIGVANNNQRSICAQNSKTGAVSQLCIGATPTGSFLTSTTLSGPSLPFTISVNGIAIPLPIIPGQPINVPWIAATTYGVKADGVTSDDVALKAAIDACAAGGLQLLLPAGKILLTGTATSDLRNCAIFGAGVPASSGTNVPGGTTLLLTSTTVKPFVCHLGWSLQGMNAYWPNQTSGTTAYPPLVTDDGTNQCGHAYVNNFNIINGYDGFRQNAPTSWVDIKVSDSTMYAVHDLFTLSKTGDSFALSNMRFTPVPWYDLCNYGSCVATVNTAAQFNTIFHGAADTGPGVTIVLSSSESFAWRYAFKIDSGSLFTGSIVEAAWDATGTLIDTTSGGIWGINNVFRGSVAGCGVVGHTEIVTNCFDLGNSAQLTLDGFTAGGATGDFFKASGSSLYMIGGKVGSVGTGETGVDHYVVNQTANNGDTAIVMRNAVFGYGNTGAATHRHGIKTVAISRLLVSDNLFLSFHEAIIAAYASVTSIVANASSGSDVASVSLTGAGSAAYQVNSWDRPPIATATGCGTGASVTGTLSGQINVGAPGPVNSCSLVVPINQTLPSCLFAPSIGVTFATAQTAPDTWAVTSASDLAGTQILFQCQGGV